MERVVIVSGVRTAVGDCGGSLKDVSALQLGAVVLKRSLKARRCVCPEVSDIMQAGEPETL